MQNYFETNTAPLCAAEFDYFRLPREQWELMLVRLKQLGVDAVTLTLPWGFHEFQRGTIDLEGTTSARRDVAGLLNLCATFDLPCLLKPGPYSNSGVLGAGIPAWLLKNSGNLEDALPLAIESWYEALSKTLVGQQWPDGPIIAIQINSEPAGEHPSAFSKQLTQVKWRIWLRKRYDGIEALNAAYGAEYRTVNDVEFPQTWANETNPLEKDAKEFLEEARGDRRAGYVQQLTDAGWQIPIYPSAFDTPPDLPALHALSLTSGRDLLDDMPTAHTLLDLHHPIQVDSDPVEVGRGPGWAENAPIRPDGSVRQKFWQVRQALWRGVWAKTNGRDERANPDFRASVTVSCFDDVSFIIEDRIFGLAFEGGLLVTSGGDAFLKIKTTAGPKSTVYRLRLNGELVAADDLKVSRGKLSGPYVAEDDTGQTDLVFLLNDSSARLSGFLLAYLRNLLAAQTQTLTRCATLAERLGKMLAPSGEPETTTSTERPTVSSYTLAEARRGLSEADAALRKAMASISALEGGFSTILGKEEIIPQPAASPVAISPEVFEDLAREILIEAGAACADIAPQLQSAAKALQKTIDNRAGFTIEQYQQSYTTAVNAAQTAREPLLEVIAQLRLEIASERLPLVVWRIHDQVQAIAESLRWGVLH